LILKSTPIVPLGLEQNVPSVQRVSKEVFPTHGSPTNNTI